MLTGSLETFRTTYIGGAGILLGLTVAVVYAYGRSALRERHALPTHVALIASSYLMAVLGLALVSADKLGWIDHEFATYFRVYVVMPYVVITGVVALTVVLIYTHRRGVVGHSRRWDSQ